VPRDDLNQWVRAIAFLRRHDVPCPNCEYNLRGNTRGRCPECGHDFDPIALAEAAPRDAQFWDLFTHPLVLTLLVLANIAAFWKFDSRVHSIGRAFSLFLPSTAPTPGPSHTLEYAILLSLLCTVALLSATGGSSASMFHVPTPTDKLRDRVAHFLIAIHTELWAPALLVLLTIIHVGNALLT
jgi:hypothetical protein